MIFPSDSMLEQNKAFLKELVSAYPLFFWWQLFVTMESCDVFKKNKRRLTVTPTATIIDHVFLRRTCDSEGVNAGALDVSSLQNKRLFCF